VGSAYWRSWWNYPPVSPELVASLKPDFIYLTHIHWDHFQGVSLRKFSRSTVIIVPRDVSLRMTKDLAQMGFHNIVELKHGASFEMAPTFKLTCYHFDVFLDSAVVVECDGTVLLNANDAKVMGWPLKQILRRHPRIDFVLRSHSSANSRLCYEIMDDPQAIVDDQSRYVRDFADFAIASKATYCIPFASNHCHLHKDVIRFNSLVTTPLMVKTYFESNNIRSPIIKLMVSGDSWSSTEGFSIAENGYFERRQERLQEYLEAQSETLERFYAKEAQATVSLKPVQKYFEKLSQATPYLLRLRLKDQFFTYIATAGERRFIFRVDLYRGEVVELQDYNDKDNPMQIHTSAFIMRQCMAMNLFSHLSISKRVRYRVTAEKKKYVQTLNHIFSLYEYDLFPVSRFLSWRYISEMLVRWREGFLYLHIAFDLLTTRRFEMNRYLPLSRR
jgi:UDP-MurNAc hydroxylase